MKIPLTYSRVTFGSEFVYIFARFSGVFFFWGAGGEGCLFVSEDLKANRGVKTGVSTSRSEDSQGLTWGLPKAVSWGTELLGRS